VPWVPRQFDITLRAHGTHVGGSGVFGSQTNQHISFTHNHQVGYGTDGSFNLFFPTGFQASLKVVADTTIVPDNGSHNP
jgi:hypothetical protein